MLGLALASTGFVFASADSRTFGAVGGVASRETAPNFFSPCFLLLNIRVEKDPNTRRVPSNPIIKPSAWKTPLTYSRRYMLFRYSSTIQSDRERITTDCIAITILERDRCPMADSALTVETNPRLPRNQIYQAMVLC